MKPRNPLRTAVAIAAALLIVPLAGGCLDLEERAPPMTSEATEPLFAASQQIWSSTTIPVCWESGGTTQERDWAMSAVRNSWGAVSNLQFTGWGLCSQSSRGLRVRMGDAGGFTTGLGRSLDGVINGVNLNTWGSAAAPRSCGNFSREDCVRSTAAHEFGHALGFAHEQNRPDRPASCTQPPQGTDGDTMVGGFDWDSVMNYCNGLRNGRGLLSLNDINGVRAYYGGPLGSALTGQADVPGGHAAYFTSGAGCAGASGPSGSSAAIYYTDLDGIGRHTVQGCIYTNYVNGRGGPAGPLGFPVTDELLINGGAVSYFHGNNCGPDRGPHGEGSAIFAGPGGVHHVQGCIYRKYRLPVAQGGQGGPSGPSGWPASGEIALPGGWASYFQGSACDASWRGPHNSGSAIFAHGNHVHNVRGCIYTKYERDYGGPPGMLGFPVTDELTVSGGWASYFAGQACGAWQGPGGSGSGIFASAAGVNAVKGCIFTAYQRDHGGPGGHLGMPASDEITLPGGWVSYFQGNACDASWRGPHNSGSAIFAHGNHVHAVQGCIYTKYIRDHGGATGMLGFPVTDEIAVNGGWASYFQGQFCGPEAGPGGSGSGIFASGATGVHSVKGCIFTGYMRDHGGPGGHLGFPVSDELQIPGGAVSYFAGNACDAFWRGPFHSGSAIYAGPGGVHHVQGCIYAKYIELGGPTSSGLGWPTSDEIAGPNGWISHFQNGYILADGVSIRVFRF